ncbi:hypothetical protein ACP6ES_06450, partial [Klebsiella quasipneumoniae]
FNQRVSLGRNDLLIRTFPNHRQAIQRPLWALFSFLASIAPRPNIPTFTTSHSAHNWALFFVGVNDMPDIAE